MARPSAMRSGQKATSTALPSRSMRRSTIAGDAGEHRAAQDQELAVVQVVGDALERADHGLGIGVEVLVDRRAEDHDHVLGRSRIVAGSADTESVPVGQDPAEHLGRTRLPVRHLARAHAGRRRPGRRRRDATLRPDSARAIPRGSPTCPQPPMTVTSTGQLVFGIAPMVSDRGHVPEMVRHLLSILTRVQTSGVPRVSVTGPRRSFLALSATPFDRAAGRRTTLAPESRRSKEERCRPARTRACRCRPVPGPPGRGAGTDLRLRVRSPAASVPVRTSSSDEASDGAPPRRRSGRTAADRRTAPALSTVSTSPTGPRRRIRPVPGCAWWSPPSTKAASIARVIARLAVAVPDAHVVVVNDGSDDDTAARALGAGATVVTLPVNLGIGGAVQAGYRYALRHGFDVAVQVDGDDQHDPFEIERLIAPIRTVGPR